MVRFCPLEKVCAISIHLPTEVVIGFEQTVYEFQEDDGFVIVRFGDLQGTLKIPMSVSFNLTPGTAQGKKRSRGKR
jgi:hypothetical protein